MAELDIRDGSENLTIDTIRFAEYDVLYNDSVDTDLIIIACDSEPIDSNYVQRIWKKDIPHLIKALQKAQELWGNT